MMSDNPYASYNIEIPRNYSDEVKRFCRSGGGRDTYEFAPFERQVDLWYFSFIYAVAEGLDPIVSKDGSNITPASILSTNSYRITHIKLAYLGRYKDLQQLADHRMVFDYALGMANAGMPYVLQLLKDPDERPLWSLLDEIERRP